MMKKPRNGFNYLKMVFGQNKSEPSHGIVLDFRG